MDKIIAKGVMLTKEASDRGRRVLLVLQITCIVVFMAAWHEMPQGWTYSRLRTAQAAVWLLDCSSPHPELRQAGHAADELDKTRHDECHYLAGLGTSAPIPIGSSSDCKRTEEAPFCTGEINNAKDFLGKSMLTPAETRKLLESLRNSFVERTLNVSVPFLGITLDVNDLGLLGGITFSLLLTWLLFSLRREAENLRILFDRAKDDALPAIYRLLEMTQVLTIPARPRSAQGRLVAVTRFILERLEFLLFLTPLLVQGFVVWNDMATLPIGKVLNDQLARREVRWEEFLLLAMTVMTLFCFRKAWQVNQHWDNAYQRIMHPALKNAPPSMNVRVSVNEPPAPEAAERKAP